MENAVDALKIAFAVLVFVIALALTFSIVGQARATSDIILALNDKTNYYDYVEQSDNNATEKDRIVDFETILPTIYRYAKEQYAVTILDTDGTPIVRYDLYTEGFMRGWDETRKKQDRLSTNYDIKEDSKLEPNFKEVRDRIKIIDDFISREFGNNERPIWKSLTANDYAENYLYKGHKVENNTAIHYVAEWMGNPNTDTIYRIQADLGYKKITTQVASGERDKYMYLDGSYEKNGVVYKGVNLNKYKDRKFKEKFLEIQTSGTTLTEQGENNIEYSLETVKGNKKLEIIYILQ